MDLDNFRILQENLAGLAFTLHFDMVTWSAPRCGTTLCLAGLSTTLELSKTNKNHEPSLDNLSTKALYKELHEQFIEFDDLNFYVFHACKYLAIPYDNELPIWHFREWPLALIELYRADRPHIIKEKYIEVFPASNLKAYAIPAYFWRALAGYLALEAFYEYTTNLDRLQDWVDSSAEAIEGCFIPEGELYEYLPKWLTKYSDRIMHFEQIAIQTEPAKQFLYKD